MRSAEEMLRDAVTAHEAGKLAAAEIRYRRVLRARPNDPRALDGLARLSVQCGSKDQAIGYLLQSLISEPDNGPTWNLLGSLYVETRRLVEGKAAFKRATELLPEVCEVWCNLASCLRNEGDLHGAEEQLRRALAGPPPRSRAYEALVDVLRDQGRLQEAAQAAADWLAHEPTNPIARHMHAALCGEDPPPRASDEYVRAHFDAFADIFDFVLQRLDYRAPELVAAALRAAADSRTQAISKPRAISTPPAIATPSSDASRVPAPAFSSLLDAGCGTGLCGPFVRELCGRLVGIDLSPRMLHHAGRRGCYDELVAAELGAYMRSQPEAFDAILCVDTLVYFGALAAPLAAAHGALRAGGPLIFTVEALLGADAPDHRLGASGRYSHGERYLRRVIGESGFALESLVQQVVRREMGRDVEGYLVVARRP